MNQRKLYQVQYLNNHAISKFAYGLFRGEKELEELFFGTSSCPNHFKLIPAVWSVLLQGKLYWSGGSRQITFGGGN